MKKILMIILSLIVVVEIGVLASLLLDLPINNLFNKKSTTETSQTVIEVTKKTTTTTTTLSESSTSQSEAATPSRRIPVDKWIKSDTEIHFPILMYHSLSEGNRLKIPPAEFKQHLEYLAANNYYTLTPEEAYIVLTENKKPKENIVWITFDDGYLNNYIDGFPLLKEFQMDATINYIINKEGSDNYFSLAQMKEMAESGFVSIESHTMNHLEVNVMDYEQQLSEFKDSKTYLDQNLNQHTTVLCYPAGRYGSNNFQALQDAGYKMAITTEPGYAAASQGLYALKRVRVSPGYDQAGFGNLINGFQ